MTSKRRVDVRSALLAQKGFKDFESICCLQVYYNRRVCGLLQCFSMANKIAVSFQVGFRDIRDFFLSPQNFLLGDFLFVFG